ncbi:MAG: HDOD domain-containing protein [Candidatus Hydrogenedentota bacterium]|nr:MAG: HDOD domain-containing protein [Candidatus Hydrogenedentota bacterium]
MSEKKRIGELLIESGYVTPEQLDQALEVQKTKRERICNILMDLGYLNEADFLEFLATVPGTASVELSSFEIDEKILNVVPQGLARRLELVPLGKIGNLLTVAMVCPLDETARKELEDVTGLKVRPVLCSQSAVFTALDRYYKEPERVGSAYGTEGDISALEGPLKLRRVGRLVEEIEELPTLPHIVNTIASILNDPHSSAADLAKVIASDVALSAKLLKLANSPAYGFSRRISDIQHAIALLGFGETQSLAMSVRIFDYLTDMAKFDFSTFWSHSLNCANLAKLISLNIAARGREGAFVAGLLHDMGKVVLTMNMPGKHEEVASLCSTGGMSGQEAEEKVFGITHAEAGYLLGEHWLLPVALTTAIRYHHTPELEPEPKGLSSIVFLANIFCKMDTSELAENTDFDGGILEALKVLRIPEVAMRKTLESYCSMLSDINF